MTVDNTAAAAKIAPGSGPADKTGGPEQLLVARQALYDRSKTVISYELLYRRSEHASKAEVVDGNEATLRVITCALLGLDVRLFRERIAQPVAAVTMFVVTERTAQLAIFGDRAHLSEELKNQEGT